MPQPVSRVQEEALQNLKLDATFFQRMLQKDGGAVQECSDYDLYLMESGLMPVLLQGLDALARHVEKLNTGTCLSGGSRAPFNPLTWLAQYLLRNHPGKVKDHRTPIYERLRELANQERSRRNQLRGPAAEEQVRRGRQEQEEHLQEQEAEHLRERTMQRVKELRKALEDEFASLCADLYTNDAITQILNKGAVIQGLVEQDGGPALVGVHIELIVAMLRLWGCHSEGSDDTWNEAAMVAWQNWLDNYGPRGGQSQVDSVNLRALMDRDAFEEYLEDLEDLEVAAVHQKRGSLDQSPGLVADDEADSFDD